MTVRELMAVLSTRDPGVEVIVASRDEDVLAISSVRTEYRNEQGILHDSPEEAQDDADLMDVDPEAEERPVVGELTEVAVIRFY